MKQRTVACDLLVLLCAQPQSAVSPTPPGQDLSLTAHHPHMPAATGDRYHIQTTSNKIHSLYFYWLPPLSKLYIFILWIIYWENFYHGRAIRRNILQLNTCIHTRELEITTKKWSHANKLRKYLSLKLYSKYLKFNYKTHYLDDLQI